MKHKNIPRRKLGQHAVYICRIHLEIGAAVQQNAVLPLLVHLNDRVPGGRGHSLQQGHIHTVVHQKLTQGKTVPADAAGVTNRKPRPRHGHGLIKALAAQVDPVARRAQCFPGLGKMGDMVNMIQIQRAEV